jgi:plasmid segregation protein ParM
MSKTILAVDVGYGNTKLVWGAARDSSCELLFKSIAPTTRQNDDAFADFSQPMDRVAINVNNRNFLVGPEAYLTGSTSSILDKDYIKHDEYLALLRGAMYYMMKKSGTIKQKIDGLVVGLPISNFNEHRDSLQKLAVGVHTLPTPSGMRNLYGSTFDVLVDKVLVLPQPIGALRNYSGNLHAGDNSVSLIVDPGYNTFDWVIAYGLRPDMQRSGSFDGGVAHIFREVSAQAGKTLGIGMIDFVQCEDALNTGILSHKSRSYPFEQFKGIAEDAAAEIVNKFASALDATRPFHRIVMAGGGASFYVTALRNQFPDFKIVVSSDSVMANARGFYAFAAGLLLES